MHESDRVVREFHERQRRFYAGGDSEPLRGMLTDDVVWRVPGDDPIAGDHAGIAAVMSYVERRLVPFDQSLFDEDRSS